MFRLALEWHEAPGVRDSVLAATWARLECEVADLSARLHVVTRCIRARSASVQRGVYGSVFPLAEWVVENWWFLLHEPCRVPELSGGRILGETPLQRPWIQRHNLLAAREGGSLPDLALYRDGDHIVAKWVPDPEQNEQVRPTRFVEDGEVRLVPADVEQGLHQFVETVIARLDNSHDEDSRRLRDNWLALCRSRSTEANLCAWAASLGLDPYDPAELSDEVLRLLNARVADLDDTLRSDLLESATAHGLPSDVGWLDDGLRHLHRNGETRSPGVKDGPTGRADAAISAHELGYRLARQMRRYFGLTIEPIPDLFRVFHERCNWPEDPEIFTPRSPEDRLLAIAGEDHQSVPRVVGPKVGELSRRFRLARAMYFLDPSRTDRSPRLITGAFTWDQRASRAFAAELLAPADALRRKVSDGVPLEQVQRLADAFQVSPLVIQHQIDNHRLGWSVEI